MENINQLIEQYNKINESIKKEEDVKIKEQLQRELSNITSMIQEELKKEQARGNASEELIQLCSKFDALTTLDKKHKEDEYNNNEVEKETIQDKNYTLASNKIISDYDGSEIDISNLSRIEKIKAIYDYTGVEINTQDPEVLKLCDLRFQEFLRGCSPSVYEQKYGEDWKKTVEQIYKSNYLSTVQMCIANGLNEVDEKNRIREKGLSEQLEQSEKEIEKLTTEVNDLKEEVVELTGTVQKIKTERKQELEQYRQIIEEKLNNKETSQFIQYTPEEKTKILRAFNIQFEYDENKRSGIGIDNDYKLVIEGGDKLAQKAREMMICKSLGINVTAEFNGITLSNTDYDDEQQICESYYSALDQGRSK